MPLKKVRDMVLEFSDVPLLFVPTVSLVVCSRMIDGQWTRKRLARVTMDKFSPVNGNYCQDFHNFMSNVDPHRLKFFDECGFALPDAASPNYGSSLKGVPCVEVGKYITNPNITLNLLIGTGGIMYADTVDGSVDTIEFLNFFDHTIYATDSMGRTTLDYGDILVLDNAGFRHGHGGYALAEVLDDIGMEVIWLPTYSPEFNPVKLVFNKLKKIAKIEDIRERFDINMHDAIFECLDRVTIQDIIGFYEHIDYITF